MRPQQTPPNDSEGLEAYFTDVEHLRELFARLCIAPNLPKHLLVIHGVGGVGKTSLLRMFRLHCKKAHVPVALASGDEAKSAVDIISNWADDLKADGIKLSAFVKSIKRYRSVQAKINEQASKGTRGKVSEALGKVASKSAEATASVIAGAAVGFVLPGISTVAGSIGGIVGGMGAEALVEWLRGFLSKPEIELILDPARKLTDDLLSDIARLALKQRLVLMIDTFEQMATLERWICDVAQRLDSNVLLVVAGRIVPNWSRIWPDWIASAEVKTLEPMAPEVMRTLVRRYYAHVRGGEPDTVQVEAIIQFARGLPMVVNSAVELWVKYGVEDFQVVKPKVVEDLVKRLREGVPPEVYPVLEAAATVRWFNKEILRAVTNLPDVNITYEELRRFPFVRSRKEGLALHDAVREIMDEGLRVDDPERHSDLHERAAVYYGTCLEKLTKEEGGALILERLYHLISVGKEALSISESLAAIEAALGYYQRPLAESIVSLLDQYLRQESSRRWLVYLQYLVLLMNANIEMQVAHTRKLVKTLNEPGLDSRLWTLIASILSEVPVEANIAVDNQIAWLTKAMDSGLLTPPEKVMGYVRLGYLSRAKDLGDAHKFFLEALQSAKQQAIPFGQIRALDGLAYNCILQGDWNKAAEWAKEEINLSRQVGGFGLPTALKHAGWALTYTGELSSALDFLQEGLQVAQQRQDDIDIMRITRRLAKIYDRQKRWNLSNELYQNQIKKDDALGRVISRSTDLTLLGISYLRQGLLEQAKNILLESTSLSHLHLDVKPYAFNAMGEVFLKLGDMENARKYFDDSNSTSRGNPYYISQSKLGILEIEFLSSKLSELESLAMQIETLSIEHSHSDLLAQLYLIKGHISWTGYIFSCHEQEVPLVHYQKSLVYALHYNRFLLDDLLSGSGGSTSLGSIISHCLKYGDDGQKMLSTLHNWWASSLNPIDASREQIASHTLQSIPLVEAERIVRKQEIGDGFEQKSVLAQIEQALKHSVKKTTLIDSSGKSGAK